MAKAYLASHCEGGQTAVEAAKSEVTPVGDRGAVPETWLLWKEREDKANRCESAKSSLNPLGFWKKSALRFQKHKGHDVQVPRCLCLIRIGSYPSTPRLYRPTLAKFLCKTFKKWHTSFTCKASACQRLDITTAFAGSSTRFVGPPWPRQ